MLSIRFFTLSCILCLSQLLLAQNPLGNSDLTQRIQTIESYLEQLKYDQAGVEVDDLRYYLKREKIVASPEVLEIGTLVYSKLNQKNEAVTFLKENIFVTSTDSPLLPQIERFKAIAKQFSLLGMHQEAHEASNSAIEAANLLVLKNQEIHAAILANQADSMRTIYNIAAPLQSNDLVLTRQQGWGFFFSLTGLFLGLFFYIFKLKRTNSRRIAEQQMNLELSRQESTEATFNTHQTIRTLEKEHEAPPRPFIPDLYQDGPELRKVALVVESDRSILMYLRSMLSKRFQVETARSTSEGLELARTILPDLIVCSSLRNGFSGVDFARVLKSTSNTEHIPVILFTESELNGALDAQRAMASKWFVRPASNEVFQDNINEILKVNYLQHVDFQRVVHHWFQNPTFKVDNQFLERVLSLIESNLADVNFTAETLAHKLNFTKLQFHRKINAMTGKTPNQLLREMRMEKAASMLRLGAIPLPVISTMVGYESAASFAYAYKGHFGDEALPFA